MNFEIFIFSISGFLQINALNAYFLSKIGGNAVNSLEIELTMLVSLKHILSIHSKIRKTGGLSFFLWLYT